MWFLWRKGAAAEGVTRAQVAVLLSLLTFQRGQLAALALEVVARRTPVRTGTVCDAGRAGVRAVAASACLYHAQRLLDDQQSPLGADAGPKTFGSRLLRLDARVRHPETYRRRETRARLRDLHSRRVASRRHLARDEFRSTRSRGRGGAFELRCTVHKLTYNAARVYHRCCHSGSLLWRLTLALVNLTRTAKEDARSPAQSRDRGSVVLLVAGARASRPRQQRASRRRGSIGAAP
ncbi:hypothetical protein MRX96_040822 [Rhipicephalus microplus]